MTIQWPSLDQIHTLVFDFDGVFTDNGVYLDGDGNEMIRCSRFDGLGINFLHKFKQQRKLAAEIFILSKEPNPVVLARAKKLKLECIHNVADKLTYLQDYLKEKHPENKSPFDGLVYVGNDLNDLAVMRRAMFSAAPSDAHPMIKECASVVLPETGGRGFVRNFCEKLLGLENYNFDELEALIQP